MLKLESRNLALKPGTNILLLKVLNQCKCQIKALCWSAALTHSLSQPKPTYSIGITTRNTTFCGMTH